MQLVAHPRNGEPLRLASLEKSPIPRQLLDRSGLKAARVDVRCRNPDLEFWWPVLALPRLEWLHLPCGVESRRVAAGTQVRDRDCSIHLPCLIVSCAAPKEHWQHSSEKQCGNRRLRDRSRQRFGGG